MLKLRLLALFAIFFVSAGSSFAQNNAIGYVKTVQGNATVTGGGQSVSAQLGTPVQIGSVLRTDKLGSMGVTFKDNTIISLGPNTEITVDEYLFAPERDELKLGASMTRGTLNYVSGIIAKLKPEAISLKTPTGIIGVRGTHFLTKIENED